jgi:hypothetical protein
MTNIELYFNMNEQRISTNQLKILLTLQHISEDAQQWKENEKTDLDDSTNVDKQWNDWTGFKTRFLKNWEELDSPGNVFSELLKLNKRKFTTGKKRLSIIKYTERFKELIRKAGITDGNAIYQYSLGLTTDEYRSIALTNLTTLQGWYDAAHRLFNIDSRLGNINQNTQSEWDMDVDVISVNALSREEREQHVRNNLCFICHKDGHVSKECPDRKPYKGGFKSGKYKGKYKKGKRFTKGHHIRATEMDDSSDEEEDVAESSQSNEEQVIRALMKKLPKEQRINMLINMEQDTPIPTDSTPMDSLDLSHVIIQSISNRRFSIPIKVETVENTEEITALIDSGAEGLFIDKSIAHKWRTSILKSPIKVRNVDGTYNENGAITERCLIPFRINDKIMTEWFYVTTLGDQNLILGLPWLEKHNPIIDWTEKTLEFRNSQEDKAKAFIRSLAQEQEETTLIEDKDLVVWYLKSHRGPEPSDQLYTPFEDIGRWNEEQPDIAIRKYSPAQQMEHKYNAKQEESILPTQYLPWKEVFEQKQQNDFQENAHGTTQLN